MKIAVFSPLSPRPSRRRLFSIACAAGVPLFPALVHGAALANFTDGAGTSSVDQYQGIAGNGWSTPWSSATDGTAAGTTFNSSIIDTNPLNGGGNYLSTTLTGVAAGGSKGAVWRRYDSSAVDTAQIHTVSFSIRLDSNWASLTNAADYIQAFDRGSSTSNSDFGNPATWLIRAFGEKPTGTNSVVAGNWMLYNGNKAGSGYNAANFIDSGVTLVSGNVYDFVISIDPANLEYRVSINGGEFSEALGFRSDATPGTLHFGGQVTGASAEVPKTLTFSVDSIAVIPEPSVAVLVLPALLGCCIRRRA